MIENGAFNDMRDGILEEMKAKGYENVEVKCAQGDASALQTIAQNMADGSYDLVLQLQHHQHRQSLILKQRHLYFLCGFGTGGCRCNHRYGKPDKNATGTSNAIPVSDILHSAINLHQM